MDKLISNTDPALGGQSEVRDRGRLLTAPSRRAQNPLQARLPSKNQQDICLEAQQEFAPHKGTQMVFGVAGDVVNDSAHLHLPGCSQVSCSPTAPISSLTLPRKRAKAGVGICIIVREQVLGQGALLTAALLKEPQPLIQRSQCAGFGRCWVWNIPQPHSCLYKTQVRPHHVTWGEPGAHLGLPTLSA